MKLKPITRSAFFNPRALTAFALFIVAGLLALIALGAVPTPFGKARVDSEKRSAAAKSASDSPKSLVASLKKMLRPRGGAARTVSGGAPTTRRGQTQKTAAGASNTKVQQNHLGQTVYSISPSQFDISPPLTELAKISLPKPPAQQLPELQLPSARILRSDKPDPVTQVAPAPRDLEPPGRSGGGRYRLQFRRHRRRHAPAGGRGVPAGHQRLGRSHSVRRDGQCALSGVVAQSHHQNSHVDSWAGRQQYALGGLRRRMCSTECRRPGCAL